VNVSIGWLLAACMFFYLACRRPEVDGWEVAALRVLLLLMSMAAMALVII